MKEITKPWKWSRKNMAVNIGLLPISTQPDLLAHPHPSCLNGYSSSCNVSRSLSRFNLRKWHLFINSTHSHPNSELTQHFSGSKLMLYKIISLSASNLYLKHGCILNPPALLPLPDRDEPREWELEMSYLVTLHPVYETPLWLILNWFCLVISHTKNEKGNCQAG